MHRRVGACHRWRWRSWRNDPLVQYRAANISVIMIRVGISMRMTAQPLMAMLLPGTHYRANDGARDHAANNAFCNIVPVDGAGAVDPDRHWRHGKHCDTGRDTKQSFHYPHPVVRVPGDTPCVCGPIVFVPLAESLTKPTANSTEHACYWGEIPAYFRPWDQFTQS